MINVSAGEDAERTEIGVADVDHCMREVKNQHWTEMDWFENIPAGAGIGGDERTEEAVEDDPDDEEAEEGHVLPVKRTEVNRIDSSGQDYLQAGLGTMV